jgi:sugar phosphate isomerase/epimerase
MAEFILSAFADEAGNSLDEQIAALNGNGIRYIEPRNIDGKGILDHTEESLASIKERLDAAGIKVGSLGSPIGKYDITADFDSYLVTFEKALRACEILGTKKMRMFSFFVTQDKLSEHRDEVIRRLKVMVNLATERGITLCHENESKIYGQMPREVNDLMDSVDGLKAIFDPANYRMNDGDVMAGIEATLKNFAYLHIKDAHYESQTILPAGEGEGRIADIINIVNDKIDGEVMLTLEPHLSIFFAYASIDDHELKGKYSFKSTREAFDFATKTLKNLLTENGYREDENGKWKK